MAPTQVSHLNTKITSKSLPIYLRTLTVADAPSHAALLSNPANGGNPAKPLTAERCAEIIAGQVKDFTVPTVLNDDGTGTVASGPGRVNMAVCVTGPDGAEKVIGLGGYGAIKNWTREGKAVRAGDAGVLLDPEYRGKGYGLESMKLAMDWGFSPVEGEGGPQMDLITITTAEDNAAMIKVIKALGFEGKGVLRPAEFDKEKNELYIEITPAQWKAVSSA